MKKIIVLFALTVTLLYTACSGGPAPEKTGVLPATGTFAYEFPDRLFRRDIIYLLNDLDGGDRNASSKISERDYSLMASVEKLDVSTRRNGTYASYMGIWNPEYFYGKNEGKENLKGIEYFTTLKELDCCYNKITELNLSKNTKLTFLNCTDNKLSKLEMTNNPSLEVLLCHRNYISAIDLSKNSSLKVLGCDSNRLSNFDLSKNPMLMVLSCYDNKLTGLDLSKNTLLEKLDCTLNYMNSSDDVRGLTNGAIMDFNAQWPGGNDYYVSLLAKDAKKY